jgi:hypothetical protein
VLQRGSTWVFQSFGALSPRAALLVIVAVTVWLPLSATISIAMHAALLANAAWLPAWAQLLHPVATIIAKSKLLALAVYPAAWPQAKRHVLVPAALRCVDCLAARGSLRKTAQRYQQAKQGFAQASDAGLRAMLKYINGLAQKPKEPTPASPAKCAHTQFDVQPSQHDDDVHPSG